MMAHKTRRENISFIIERIIFIIGPNDFVSFSKVRTFIQYAAAITVNK